MRKYNTTNISASNLFSIGNKNMVCGDNADGDDKQEMASPSVFLLHKKII